MNFKFQFFLIFSIFIYVNCKCVTYGIDSYFFFGPILNAIEMEPKELKEKNNTKAFYNLCPDLRNQGNLSCCDQQQLEYLEAFKKIYNFDKPECTRNYLDLFCQINCNSNQSKYIEVLEKHKPDSKGRSKLYKISLRIDLDFVNKFYNQCKDSNSSHFNSSFSYFLGKPIDGIEFFFQTNRWSSYHIDFNFYDKQKNTTFHMVDIKRAPKFFRDDVSISYRNETVLNPKELLPITFKENSN